MGADAGSLTDVPFTTVASVLLSSEYPMELTGWEEQVVAFATTLKGEPTAAALAGELTEIPELEAVEVDPEVVEVEVVEVELVEVDPAFVELDPGAEGDVVGEMVACVAWEAVPPQPVATATETLNKERARTLGFKKFTIFIPSWRSLAESISRNAIQEMP